MAFLYKFLILFSFLVFTKSVYASALSEGIGAKEEAEKPFRLKRARSFEIEYNPPENLKIVIIGGGYTGMLSAVVLRQIIPDAEIILIEKEQHLLTGASLTPGRLHLGGEYPLDPETSVSCLWGAFLLKQMLGDTILTKVPAAQYLVAKDLDASGLTVAQQKEAYERNIKAVYQDVYDRFYEKSPHKEDFFGPPEDLLRDMSVDEMPSTHFVGGVEVKEHGIHPIKMAAALKHLVCFSDVRVMTDTEVLRVKNEGGWILNTNRGGITADFVVNATWQEIYNLDKAAQSSAKAGKLGGLSPVMSPPTAEYHIFSRAMLIVDTAQEGAGAAAASSSFSSSTAAAVPSDGEALAEESDLRAYFGLLGSKGGMFSAVNRSTALLYWPDEKGSYVAGTRLGGSRTLSAPAFMRLMYGAKEEEKTPGDISARILTDLKEKYPKLAGAKPLRLVVRETLSHGPDLDKRPPIPVVEKEKGWISALSTKATFSAITALNVAKIILSHVEGSEEEEDDKEAVPKAAKIAKKTVVSFADNAFFLNLKSSPSPETWILPEELRFSEMLLDLEDRSFIQDAYQRRLPIAMAMDGVMWPTLTPAKEAETFVKTLPEVVDLAAVDLDSGEKEVLIDYIGLPGSAVQLLNLSYVRFTQPEMVDFIKALASNTSLKKIVLRGMGLMGEPLSSVLEVLKTKEIEFLDLSLNSIDTQSRGARGKNLLDIHEFITAVPNSLNTFVIEGMGIKEKDTGILMGAAHERKSMGKHSIDIKITAPSFGDDMVISVRGLTVPERMGLARQFSLSLESDAALPGSSPPAEGLSSLGIDE